MSRQKASSLATMDLPQTPVEISLIEEDGGIVMRTDAGLALYRYDRDVDGKSHCTGACSRKWPPVLASAGASRIGDWTTVKRADSTRQWAFKGKPVYTYADDAPGRTDGDGIGGVWHLVTP